MTADKKKKTKTEAAEPWPYYTLKKDGHLYDEDGKKVFTNVNFRNIDDAEKWLENHNERGNVTIE